MILIDLKIEKKKERQKDRWIEGKIVRKKDRLRERK